MSLTSLNIASLGHLDGGANPALNFAVLGLLRDDGDAPPPITPAGGGGIRKIARKKQARQRIQHVRDVVDAMRKGREGERLDVMRAEAIEIAEAEDMEVQAERLRRASTLKDVRAGVKALAQAANAEIKRLVDAENSRIEREQAIRQEKERQRIARDARIDQVIAAERERITALRQENEDIAIALLLAI